MVGLKSDALNRVLMLITVFIKDLALGGRYSSRFLLACIFALAARHCDHQSPVYLGRGDQFLTVAKELLVSELSSPRPAFATIQGLLVLGYRQFGIGHTSEGWLFSGMVGFTCHFQIC